MHNSPLGLRIVGVQGLPLQATHPNDFSAERPVHEAQQGDEPGLVKLFPCKPLMLQLQDNQVGDVSIAELRC